MNRRVLKNAALATLTAGLLLASTAGVASPGEGFNYRVGEGQKSAAYSPTRPGPVFRFPYSPVFYGSYTVVLNPFRCLWSCRNFQPVDIRLTP